MLLEVDFSTDGGAWQETHQAVIQKALEAVCSYIELPFYSVSILLTNDAKMQTINQEFMGKDKPTNVLSFPQLELVPYEWSALKNLAQEDPIGDIAFAYETIAKEATLEEKTFQDHLTHLTVHGLLHILGFDHMTQHDATTMESLEIQILQTLSIVNPYANTK